MFESDKWDIQCKYMYLFTTNKMTEMKRILTDPKLAIVQNLNNKDSFHS